MTESSRADLNVDQNRNDEPPNAESFEDGEFQALKRNYDRQSLTRHIFHNELSPIARFWQNRTILTLIFPIEL